MWVQQLAVAAVAFLLCFFPFFGDTFAVFDEHIIENVFAVDEFFCATSGFPKCGCQSHENLSNKKDGEDIQLVL